MSGIILPSMASFPLPFSTLFVGSFNFRAGKGGERKGIEQMPEIPMSKYRPRRRAGDLESIVLTRRRQSNAGNLMAVAADDLETEPVKEKGLADFGDTPRFMEH